MNSATASTPSTDKHSKITNKLVTDLEDLVKKLANFQNLNHNDCNFAIRDDCVELQKFCAKLEYLLQFNLRERKGSSSSAESREYWTFIQDMLKTSRSFEDAIKYVKNINEIKTNIGRARGFIRFCLQYHRLADAIQQLIMEEKLLNVWYKEKSVWFNEQLKSRIIQLLYDLNDLNFELISRNDFELDTNWPSININSMKRNSPSEINRNRTLSICSYTSINTERDRDQTDSHSILLSSTPLEMDDDLGMYSNLREKENEMAQIPETNMAQSVYYDTAISSLSTDQYEKKIEDLMNQLSVKESKINKLTQANETNALNLSSESQLSSLNEKINQKVKQISELNNCLVKQTNLSENLSEMLKKSNEKIADLNSMIEKQLNTINILENENNALKFDLSSKTIYEVQLKKDIAEQSKSIDCLKKMSYEQEKTIKQLKLELDAAINERSSEFDAQHDQAQRNKISIQLKEEEIYLLNDQIQNLSRALDSERQKNEHLTNELNELKLFYQDLIQKNSSQIQQLEADNVEIKKRLIKLIKEKAELWQKADNLEYENLLKTNSMWLDDSNVSNCMNCNSQFGILLRKHHCRICLKIYCYYCCNNWIEYNNNKLRVCKKCCAARDTVNRIKGFLSDEKSTPEMSETNDESTNDQDDLDDEDADVNFEVRSEKLIPSVNYDETSIYDQPNKKEMLCAAASSSSSPKEIRFDVDDFLDEEEELERFDEEKLSVSSSSKFLNKIAHKFEFKYFTKSASDGPKTADELVVERKKKIKKKSKSSQSFTSMNQDDLETFAIVSQEEIDKIKN
ncbi:FYVE and coiled-coil domain-containing 1-like isoform X1 [Brachionus plicatilis]|uniref:FYVE and coiled-coil domain-containing 1-like isoform X1 n=1 Tax=Brachionus plicatilis TaxID=10195 RepID=A0A3M7QJ38_BRAPC|nr:FYVE and coiled-coil domain-containing 1-like isoform X1 [Brachionus plicatilis]